MKVHSQRTGNLPDRAGIAHLRYDDIKQPKRKKDIITLPSEGWDLYWLSFDQFICLKTKSVFGGYQNELEKKETWFGGTDEKPFLVKMNEHIGREGYGNEKSWLDVWKQEAFYEDIKPEIIKHFEKTYGKRKTKRQGDIFAYPMPEQNWDKLLNLMECMKREVYIKYTSENLYSTRHTLKGEYIEEGDYIVGKGKIEAPDHKPLILEEICVLAQTENLHNPKKAD